MMSRAVTVLQTFTLIECARCFISFGVPDDFERRRRNDHEAFYCPSGHLMSFPGQSEAEALKVKLAHEIRLREIADADKARVVAEMKRIGERVTNGVCPCCSRSFKDLRAHMRSKHSAVKQIGAA